MIKEILAIVGVITVCSANAAGNLQRSGNANRYFVYTRTNFPDPVEVIANSPPTIDNSDILLSRDTVVIVHGHQASAFDSLNPQLRNTYIQNLDVNVIIVDWSTSARLTYALAMSDVPSVGANLGDLIAVLVQANRVNLDRLHLIGFDLGAHAVGFAGRRLQGNVARITGLSPAGKNWGSNSGHLTRSDARYVEVIHTDSSGLFSSGIDSAIGHVDFFANGGSNQPGCVLSACHHNRAWELFSATLIEDHKLEGNGCATAAQLKWNRCNGSPLVMGTNVYSKTGSGIYRVNTGRSFPF